jgi:hypothetical protein
VDSATLRRSQLLSVIKSLAEIMIMCIIVRIVPSD